MTVRRRKLKICPHCGDPRPLTAEYWHPNPRSKTGFQGWCRLCVIAHARENEAVNYAVLRELKESAPCADCGLYFPAYVMDFDHLPGTDKVNDISQMARGGRERLLAEIPKCEIVCANCHAQRTWERNPGLPAISEQQARLRQMKESAACAGCHRRYPHYVMTFSQRPGETGGADVSRMASRKRRWAVIEAEIATRDIVCFNCHRERRWGGERQRPARKPRRFKHAGHPVVMPNNR
jgi:hypothetical protein